MIDEYVARRYWPNGDALGHRLLNDPPGASGDYLTVVGVVGAVNHGDLAYPWAMGAIYFPSRHYASLQFSLTLRTAQAPELAASALWAAVLRIRPELALHDLKSMSTRLHESLAGRRLPLVLGAIFAAILAAVGIYGVLAYTVVGWRSAHNLNKSCDSFWRSVDVCW